MKNTFYSGGHQNSRKPELAHLGSGEAGQSYALNNTLSTLNQSINQTAISPGHVRKTTLDIALNNTNISVMSDKYSAMLA